MIFLAPEAAETKEERQDRDTARGAYAFLGQDGEAWQVYFTVDDILETNIFCGRTYYTFYVLWFRTAPNAPSK